MIRLTSSVWQIRNKLVRRLEASTPSAASSSFSFPFSATHVTQQTIVRETEENVGTVTSSVGFSFTPGGLLFPYSLGVAAALRDRQVLVDTTPIAGASAGSLCAAVVGCGLSMEMTMVATAKLAADCRDYGTRFRLGEVLNGTLQELIPENAHELIKARPGRIGVAITSFLPWPVGQVVHEFYSKQDLIACLLGSCAVPLWFTKGLTVDVRGYPTVDGFFASPRKHFGAPELSASASRTVRICPFPSAVMGLESATEGDVISPSVDEAGVNDQLKRLVTLALNPGTDAQLEDMFESGYQAGREWVDQYAAKFVE